MASSVSLSSLIPKPLTDEDNLDLDTYFSNGIVSLPIGCPKKVSEARPTFETTFINNFELKGLSSLSPNQEKTPFLQPSLRFSYPSPFTPTSNFTDFILQPSSDSEATVPAPNALELQLYGKSNAGATTYRFESSNKSLSTLNVSSAAEVQPAPYYNEYHAPISAPSYSRSQASNTIEVPVIATNPNAFYLATRTSPPPVLPFPSYDAPTTSYLSTVRSSVRSPAIAPSKRVVSRKTKTSHYNIQSRSFFSRESDPTADDIYGWQLQQIAPTSSQQYPPPLSEFNDGFLGLPTSNGFGFASGPIGYGPQTFSTPPFEPTPSLPLLAHPEYAKFLPSAYPSATIPAPQPTPALPPSTSSTLSTLPSLLPSSISTPSTTKASSKRTCKASKARAKAASCPPSLIPKVDRLHYLLTTRKNVITRTIYDVKLVHDYMWANILADRISSEDEEVVVVAGSGRKKCPGQPATYVVDRHGGVERAKMYLATSKEDRVAATRDVKGSNKRRNILYARRDFYCFIRGCGKCFDRSDKLARHIASIEEHRGIKPYVCPHVGCTREYLKESNLEHHMTAHLNAGHPDLPFPYPWNSPYSGMGDLVSNACAIMEKVTWEEDGDVNL
ncbi:hypothetical protein M422DRAFT_41831 [Sphaerobolus stellatus SS14]|nr:hypothetical protein M422DRAFT_41831 [Sphaerobolus stellatus SS14]